MTIITTTYFIFPQHLRYRCCDDKCFYSNKLLHHLTLGLLGAHSWICTNNLPNFFGILLLIVCEHLLESLTRFARAPQRFAGERSNYFAIKTLALTEGLEPSITCFVDKCVIHYTMQALARHLGIEPNTLVLEGLCSIR